MAAPYLIVWAIIFQKIVKEKKSLLGANGVLSYNPKTKDIWFTLKNDKEKNPNCHR